MSYSIKEVAERFGVTPHTLRFYEKEGLLLWVNRNNSGVRSYSDLNLEWLALICCMRATGMPISYIKRYVDLCAQGDATIEERRRIILGQKEILQDKIRELQGNIALIDKKLRYYDELGGHQTV